MKVSRRSGSIFPNEVGVCTLKIRALSTESLCNVFSIKKVLGLTILSQGPFHSALNNCERKKTLSNIIINVTALIGRLRHRQNIDSFSIVDFVDFTIINDNYYGARKNCFACLLFKKPMHADLNNIISCLIKH